MQILNVLMREYKITIKSTVDGETNEMITYGNVAKEYGATSVNYFDEQTKSPTRIVIGLDNVSIIREGEISSVLIFEQGRVTDSAIRTEYGDIPLALETTGINRDINENAVSLSLDYVTDFGGERSRFNISLFAEKLTVNNATSVKN